MFRIISVLFLLAVVCPTHAQQLAYQEYEVSQPAEAQGGLSALQKFMAVNVRKSFLAQVANVHGLIILQGVVEPDGCIAEVSILRSLEPDCDAEVLRAFALFNAWKPAQKDRKPVRQRVTFPYQLPGNGPIDYQHGVATRYYTADMKLVGPSDTTARYRARTHVDVLGMPEGPLTYWTRNGPNWKDEIKVLCIPEAWQHGGKLVLHRLPNLASFGTVYQFDKNGLLRSEYVQAPDGRILLRHDRDEQGMVIRHTETVGDYSLETGWYGTGQMKYVTAMSLRPDAVDNSFNPQLLARWNETGEQVISEGNGTLRITERTGSMRNYNRLVEVIEDWVYEKGKKHGRSVGRYADGSCWYEDVYERGVWQQQRIVFAGHPDTLTYTPTDRPASFVGGLAWLNQFIRENLKYPPEARRAGIEGTVQIRFTVLFDGKLTDIEVVQSVHPALDTEAVRLVKAMDASREQRWQPATEQGRPVRRQYTLPVHFYAE